MKYILSCFALFIIGLSGQAVRENDADAAAISKLNFALTALNDARTSQASSSEQVVEGMMLLAENEEQPLRPLVTRFADELTREMAGRRLKTDQIAAVRQCMVDVMHKTGSSNFTLASRLQEAMTSIGISSSKRLLIVNDFIKVGEAVRGPDDLSTKSAPPKPK
jgi:hypothetical protein